MKRGSLARPRARLRRIDNPRRAITFLIVTALAAAAGFGLGVLVRSPNAQLLEARNQSIPVTATVAMRTVDDTVRIQGEVLAAMAMPITVAPPPGTVRTVVTATTVAPGQALGAGDLLGTVSDRPVFVFSSDVPLFRDLVRGDRGSDVKALQASFGLPTTGVVDQTTLNMIAGLYRRAGLALPPGSGSRPPILLSEFVTFDAGLGVPVVQDIAPIGTVVSNDRPFATVRFGQPRVNVRASVSQADGIAVGDAVTVTDEQAKTVPGTVSAISGFKADTTGSGRPPGRDVSIELQAGSDIPDGAIVAVLFGASAEPTMTVPTVAIRSDEDGSYVLRMRSNDVADRINVQPVRSSGGWTAVKSTDLTTGDRILVSG